MKEYEELVEANTLADNMGRQVEKLRKIIRAERVVFWKSPSLAEKLQKAQAEPNKYLSAHMDTPSYYDVLGPKSKKVYINQDWRLEIYRGKSPAEGGKIKITKLLAETYFEMAPSHINNKVVLRAIEEIELTAHASGKARWMRLSRCAGDLTMCGTVGWRIFDDLTMNNCQMEEGMPITITDFTLSLP